MNMSKPIEPYKCALSLSNDILRAVSEISFKLGRLSLTQEHKADEEDFVSATKATLALEGVELKPSEVRGLKQGRGVPSAPLASAVYDLYASMRRIDPYDRAFQAHFEAAIWKEGVPHRLSRRVVSFPYPIPMHARVESLIHGLYSFANAGRGKIHPLITGCLFYFELMAIQPYSEYTGILARYLLKAFVGSFQANLYCLPLERAFLVQKEKLDAAYEEAVGRADTGPFVKAVLGIINDGIDTLQRRAVRKAPEQSPLVRRMLDKMEDGRFYGAAELCELLGLKSRLGLQKNYLKPALEAGLIEMSNPVSRTDRTQRYRKK